MKKVAVATWSTLPDREPTHALVANVDLVIVRYDDDSEGRLARLTWDSILDGIELYDYSYTTDGSLKQVDSSYGADETPWHTTTYDSGCGFVDPLLWQRCRLHGDARHPRGCRLGLL